MLPLIVILSVCSGVVPATAGAALSASPSAGSPVYLEADATFYCDNLEYENHYSVGRTYLGVYTPLTLTYVRPAFDLSLGALLQRDFGDEEEISRAVPLFRFRYRTPGFQLLFGQLDSAGNHGLPEPILARQYAYEYPVEEGLQFLASYGGLAADLWINWYLLNTPEHREFFAAGLHTRGEWSFVSAELGARLSHHGGQLYEVGKVSDNLSGMFRLLLSIHWNALDADLGASGTFLGAYDQQDRQHSERNTQGYGAEGECFFSPGGWKIYYRFFAGDDFLVEQGDPLYRTEKPLHRFGLLKDFQLDSAVRARLQAEGVVIESVVEYNYAFVVDVSLDLLLHRFPAAAE